MLKIMNSGDDVLIEYASEEAEILISTGDAVVANKNDFEISLRKLKDLSKSSDLELLLNDFPVFYVSEQDVAGNYGEGILYNHKHLMTLSKLLFNTLDKDLVNSFIKSYSYDACKIS